MPNTNKKTTYFYPDLGSARDLWFVRLAGHGLGNSFYSYFHAVVLAEKHNGIVIAPTWFSIKPGLQKGGSRRWYWRMFRPFPGELCKFSKLSTLSKTLNNHNRLEIDAGSEPDVASGKVNVVSCRNFTFKGLHSYRDTIRKRLLGIVNDPIPSGHIWGGNNFIAVHVRLGDFITATDVNSLIGGQEITRIPLTWYVNIVQALQTHYPNMPVHIFSDGNDQEIQPLLQLGATAYRSGSDITDLLAMSSASILVGSNSTYSQWAVFLGDMPSIWLERKVPTEKPSDRNTPILFIPFDATPSEVKILTAIPH